MVKKILSKPVLDSTSRFVSGSHQDEIHDQTFFFGCAQLRQKCAHLRICCL
tara:strand:- start:60155 stop:60307 length:153 start_codon:yes stop_codon:yes gene_type:complete